MRLCTMTVTGFLAIATTAHAQGPSFDCSKAESEAETEICASEPLSALDRELARLFALAVHGPNMSDDRLSELRAYQRGWIKGRDDCWKSDLGVPTCVREQYAMRISDIRTGYGDARDTPGASIGPVPFVCDGLEAPVSAVFITTEEPLAVLTSRDEIDVLASERSGSGAKYSDGQTVFWTKGDMASWTDADGHEYACKVDVTD